jgi:hypothetical protein
MPGVILIGVVIMIIGFIVFAYGLYAIVTAAMGELSGSGLLRGFGIFFFSVVFMAVGGIFLFVGIGRRFWGRKHRRILY